MVKRTIFLLFIFISTDATASSKAIPTVWVKPHKKFNTTLSNGPTEILTHEQMETAGINTLAQALQNLGGIQTNDISGSGRLTLSMRGFGANASSNTLILVNGIPITNPDLAPPDINAIALNDIEVIEIMSGTESVLYGDQAVSGAINIVTRHKKNNGVTLTCDKGSYQQQDCDLTLNNHIKQLDYSVSLAEQTTDNYRQHNRAQQSILWGLFNYTNSNYQLAFDYHLAHEMMQYPGGLSALQVAQNRRQASNASDYFKDNNAILHLQWQQKLNQNLQLETDLARREMHGSGVLFSSFSQSRVSDFLKSQIKSEIDKTLVKGGIDLQQDGYHLGSLYGVTNDAQQKYSAFLLLNRALTANWDLALGTRAAEQLSTISSLTKDNNINRALVTTIGLSYHYAQMRLYFRRAGSFRFPKADENAFSVPGANGLRTQRGNAFETGINLTQATYSGQLALYQLNLSDEIAFDPTQTVTAPFGTNRNLARTRRYGGALSLHKTLSSQLALDSQYHFVSARFKDGINANHRIPLVAENMLHAAIQYQFAAHWSLYTEAMVMGNQYPANDDQNITHKQGGYTTYNINLHYANKQLTAGFHLNNIFNKYYYLYTVYTPALLNEIYYPAPGRSILFMVKYNWA